MLPVIIKDPHNTPTTSLSVAEKADDKSNTEHLNSFNKVSVICSPQTIWEPRLNLFSASTEIKCKTSSIDFNTDNTLTGEGILKQAALWCSQVYQERSWSGHKTHFSSW